MSSRSYWPNAESWRRHWPARIVTLIATIQLIISFLIVLIHSTIVGIGVGVFCIGAAPWFIMGFVCWVVFFVCWISMFCVSEYSLYYCSCVSIVRVKCFQKQWCIFNKIIP